MRTAILALTPAGAGVAEKIRRVLGDEAELWLSPRAAGKWQGGSAQRFDRVSEVMREVFPAYDAIVAIMAAGIVVRSLAPLVQDKLHDPAVVVLDERGRHAISLLSGHVGGANALARSIAAGIGAEPVITTATDCEHLMAPDAIAHALALRPWPKENIQRFNTALLHGASLRWRIAEDMPHRSFYEQALTAYGIRWQEAKSGGKEMDSGAKNALSVILQEKQPPLKGINGKMGALYLLPRVLYAGIGCRRGVDAETILGAVDEACRRIGRDRTWLAGIGTTEHKADERGLHEAARQLDIPLRWYSDAQMQAMITAHFLPESPFVKKTIGIGNVCEAAALCMAGGQGRFALTKAKFEKVTVALLWQN